MFLQNLRYLLLAAFAPTGDGPRAPAPKATPAREGKHRKGRQPARDAERLRRSRRKMAAQSRRINRER
jgi:hypothetical protein